MKKLFVILTNIIIVSTLSFSQNTTSKNDNSKNYQSTNVTLTENQKHRTPVPGYLITELNRARKQGNESEVRRLEKLIEGYYEKKNYNYLMPDASPVKSPPLVLKDNWLPFDMMIFNGNVKPDSASLDFKYAKDGGLYAAFIGVPQSGNTGVIYVYKSLNGGLNWNYVSGLQSTSYYFGQISLLVDRDGNIADSIRVLVYYSASTNSNMDNAVIGCISFRRDGLGWYNTIVAAPSVGNKYLYPSACSDGWFNNAYTYMHVIFIQYTGSNPTYLWHCRTTDWGKTHLNSPSSISYAYTYPSAAMKAYYSTEDDTIYVACVRLFSGKQQEIQLMKTTGSPGNSWSEIKSFIGQQTTRKPKLTIVQQNIPANQKKMLLTYLEEITELHYAGMKSYSYGGKTWSNSISILPAYTLQNNINCTSDTNTSTGNYITLMIHKWDSIKIWKGSLEQTFSYFGKANYNSTNSYICPVPAIYRQGSMNYSTILFAGGVGNQGVYFNGENLTTGIINISSEIPDIFYLHQNYPNPFNSTSKIKYKISNITSVSISVYDMQGREVKTLVNEIHTRGIYEVTFDGSDLSSGIYFYRLQTESFTDAKKMLMIK